MLTPTPTRGGPSHNNNNNSYHPQTGDGYMCAVCGYSVLHSHPQLLIECHYCAQWFHRACVHISERDASQIVKYACYSCSSGSDSKLGDGAVSAYLADPHQQQPQQQTMAAGSVYDNNNNTEYKYMSDRSAADNNNRRSDGVNLYKKNTDEFRRALTSGFYAKSGVRILQPQVRPQCLFVCFVGVLCVHVLSCLRICTMQCMWRACACRLVQKSRMSCLFSPD